MRYLKATIFIAILAYGLVAGLFEFGAFRALDAKLSAFLGWPFTPPIGRGMQHGLTLLIALGIGWATIDIARTSLKVLIAGAALIEVCISVWVSNVYGNYFSPFAPAFAITVAFLIGLAYSRTAPGRRKSTLHHLLGDRVSPQTFAALLDSKDPLKFEGDVRDGTIIVCEIFNHRELSTALRVPDYVEMTNLFLRSTSDFLVEKGAYLDDCDGESLRAVFGAPLPDPRHAARACEAALALTAKLEAVNRECKNVWGHRFDYCIGINSGEMVMAAYGSSRLGAFSVAGEPVEFGRRLCVANTIYGSRILIGSGTFTHAEAEVEVRPMELIQRHPHQPEREEVYELVGMRNNFSPEDRERRDLFWKGIVFFREQRWDDALTAFKLAMELGDGDPPAEFYIRRIEQLRAGVPSLDWASARA